MKCEIARFGFRVSMLGTVQKEQRSKPSGTISSRFLDYDERRLPHSRRMSKTSRETRVRSICCGAGSCSSSTKVLEKISHPRNRRLSNTSRSEEHTSELQSHSDLVCRLLLEKKKKKIIIT